MLIRSPKQRKSITLSEPQGTLKARRHQHEMSTQLCAGRDIKQNQTGELLWRDTGGIHWQILASRSGLILARYSAGSTGKGYSAGCSAGSTASYSERDTRGIHWRLLWRDTRRDPLARYSCGILGGTRRRATLGYSAGYSAGCWRAVVGYSAGSTGEPLWRDTGRDPMASRSGGILGGIQDTWRDHLAGHSRDPLEQLWRDTRRDPLASSSLAGNWVGAWFRSIANADSNIKSNNPFLLGGEQPMKNKNT